VKFDFSMPGRNSFRTTISACSKIRSMAAKIVVFEGKSYRLKDASLGRAYPVETKATA